MEIKFIGQGLFPDSEQTIGNVLIDSLKNTEFEKLTYIVAFASPGGVGVLGEYLAKAKTHFKEVDLYVGIDLKGTSKQALDALVGLAINANIFYTTSGMVFHPKIYIFEGSSKCRIVVGSANLTTSGLFYNAEAAVVVNFEKSDKDGIKFLDEIRYYYRDLLSGKDQNLATLDADLIKKLVNLKLIANDIERKRAQEKSERKTGDAKQLAELFPSRKLGKIPSFAKTKGGGIKSGPKPKGVKATPAGGTSFWIQTGALTGGSGNQIDLSMSGPHRTKGSISLFGIDPGKQDVIKSISLKYKGVTYQGNTIKFPLNSTGLTNGTWRMQLHGVANNGDKLTAICSKHFRHTIIVFRKLAEDSYEMTIIGESRLEQMKKQSLYWDQNSSTRGKHFGKIQ